MLVKKDEASKKSVINILKVRYFFEYIFLYLIEIVLIIVNHLNWHISIDSSFQRLDDTLAEKGTRFLTGDTLCCFDCELMPKLQHIRVAGRYFENFDIPNELSHLWQYVKEMYELDAFVQVGCHIKCTPLALIIRTNIDAKHMT